MPESIYHLLEANAARFPNKAAFVFKHGRHWNTITFRQLLDRSEQFACDLDSLGLHAGQRAALLSPPSADFFAFMLALLKTGIVSVILDPAMGLAKVTECLRETQPEIFVGNTLTHAIRKLYGWGKDSVQQNISINSVERLTINVQRSMPTINLDSSSPAGILYTSGSTGTPKGVIYTQRNLIAQLEMLAATFNIQSDEIDLPAFPVFALIDCLIGVTSIIPDMRFPRPADVDPAKLTDAIDRFGVTNTFASPIMLDHLAAYGLASGLQLPSLKRVITAGAPAPVAVLEKAAQFLPDAKIFGIYGATETLPITVIDSREILEEARHQSARGAGVCIGKPVDGACVRVIPISESAIPQWDDSLELPVTQVGEITVKGDAVTDKYIARADANRLAKIDDHGETVHRMGDLGYFDEQDRLWYCGRKSHRVETAHSIFFTEQIEGIFNVHPLVYRTALVGVDGEPVLWVELEPHARRADRKAIQRELITLAKHHPQAAQIRTFLFAKTFPTDIRHNSKIIREELALLARKSIH
jgi:acyl-CoA synthetase (AMP-forming)/AMP-acid ligase II